jgi:hypothetical protein
MKFWNTAGATVPSGASPDFHTKAVDMDGSTEYMSNTTNVTMWFADTVSFSIWINPDSSAAQRYLLDISNWTNSVNRNFIYINATDDTVRFVHYSSDGSTTSRRRTTTTVTEWSINHICWTYTSNSLDIYIDWVKETSFNEDSVNATTATDSTREVSLWAKGVWTLWDNSFPWLYCRADSWSVKLDDANVTAIYDSWNWYKLDLRNDVGNYNQSASLCHQWALGKNVSPDIWEDFVSSWNINVEDNAANIADGDIVTFT